MCRVEFAIKTCQKRAFVHGFVSVPSRSQRSPAATARDAAGQGAASPGAGVEPPYTAPCPCRGEASPVEDAAFSTWLLPQS